jgi:hypothetical protein
MSSSCSDSNVAAATALAAQSQAMTAAIANANWQAPAFETERNRIERERQVEARLFAKKFRDGTRDHVKCSIDNFIAHENNILLIITML